MKHSGEVIKQVMELRQKGMSIPEIVHVTGLSKTTIWHHIKGVVLDPEAQRKIRSRQGGSRERYERNLNRARREADKIVKSKDVSELARHVAMLYWAEGSKRELVFTNTDADMIRLYLRFAEKCLNIKRVNLFLLIRISDPIDPRNAVEYWRAQTGVLKKNIKINHNNVQNRTKTPYGICRVTTLKGSYSLKVVQCIIGIIKDKLLPL